VAVGRVVAGEALRCGREGVARKTRTWADPSLGSVIDQDNRAEERPRVQLALIKQLLAGTNPIEAIEQVELMRRTAAENPDLDRGYFDEGCPGEQTSNGEVQLYGCYKRKWGVTENGQKHAGAESFAAATNVAHGWRLRIVTVAHSYGAAQMKEFNPLQGFDQRSCGSRSISLSKYGVSLSQSQSLCPERYTVALLGQGRVYGVDWRGTHTAVNDARATQLLEVAGAPETSPAFGYKFHMDMKTESPCPPEPIECYPYTGFGPFDGGLPGMELLPVDWP
ncbi:MAG TPA: hypothetical protein VF230_02770, partial [Acidimicrobiales bacterium]